MNLCIVMFEQICINYLFLCEYSRYINILININKSIYIYISFRVKLFAADEDIFAVSKYTAKQTNFIN